MTSKRHSTDFASNLIADKNLQEDPYRFLVCADKFQTGYDEPLLHTMYVDKHSVRFCLTYKTLSVSTARTHRDDVFVLDFMNDSLHHPRGLRADYYRTTILAEETDPGQAART